jgi:hypothetical protein
MVDMAMDQYLLIPFLRGWTSIYQLFWCSPGVQGFDTLPYIELVNFRSPLVSPKICSAGVLPLRDYLIDLGVYNSRLADAGLGWCLLSTWFLPKRWSCNQYRYYAIPVYIYVYIYTHTICTSLSLYIYIHTVHYRIAQLWQSFWLCELQA